MVDPKKIRLLVVEDDLEDDQFLRDAVDEIIEAPNWPNWHTCEVIPADCLSEALDLIQRCSFDAILLNLSLPDGDTLLGTFASVQAAAGSTPVIVLADSGDERLAHSLLRAGAQDVLLKPEIDAASLARSLRYAMERQRRVNALESVAFFDELTGLYNQRGFAALAAHDLEMARRRGDSLLIIVFELHLFLQDDVTIIRAGELLRTCFGETVVVARIDRQRFGVCTTTHTEGAAESVLQSLLPGLENASAHIGIASYSTDRPGGIAELLDEATSRLLPKIGMLAH